MHFGLLGSAPGLSDEHASLRGSLGKLDIEEQVASASVNHEVDFPLAVAKEEQALSFAAQKQLLAQLSPAVAAQRKKIQVSATKRGRRMPAL
jgi:hypothetical protein